MRFNREKVTPIVAALGALGVTAGLTLHSMAGANPCSGPRCGAQQKTVAATGERVAPADALDGDAGDSATAEAADAAGATGATGATATAGRKATASKPAAKTTTTKPGTHASTTTTSFVADSGSGSPDPGAVATTTTTIVPQVSLPLSVPAP